MAREKNKKCPECGDWFSSQGFAGHVKMSHGLEPGEVTPANKEGSSGSTRVSDGMAPSNTGKENSKNEEGSSSENEPENKQSVQELDRPELEDRLMDLVDRMKSIRQKMAEVKKCDQSRFKVRGVDLTCQEAKSALKIQERRVRNEIKDVREELEKKVGEEGKAVGAGN